MRTRQRKARKGSCHSSLFVTDARSGHFAPISGIIVHSFDLQSLFQSFRSFEKRFTLCSSSKKKYGTDRQKFPGSLNLRSPFGRKTFLRQNKVNPEDDNPQPTLPATIKESHAPVTMVPSLPAHNLRNDGPQRQNEKLSNMSDFNVFAPSEFIPPGAILNFGDWADSLVTARTIAATRSVGNCTHRPVR